MSGLYPNSRWPLALVLIGSLGAALGGCWTSAEAGERLRKQAIERDGRISALEEESRANRSELNSKLAQLEEVLQKATEMLTRSSADRGVQVDQLQERLAAIEGQLAELRHGYDASLQQTSSRTDEIAGRVDQLARKVGMDLPLPAESIPPDKNVHFNTALAEYKAGAHSKARALFREYITRYPNDEQSDNALYWIGTTYLAEGKPATALGEFRKVIAEFSRGDAVDGSLLNMAEAFYQLHACTDAKSALEALLRRKLSREMQQSAKEKLTTIKKAPPKYCTS